MPAKKTEAKPSKTRVSAQYKAALNDTARHLDAIEEAESAQTLCRHVLHSGSRCKAVALHGEHFCYFHQKTRGTHYTGGYVKEPFLAYKPLEDRHSVQTMLNDVLSAFTNRFIDERTARLYLYGIQLSMANFGRDTQLAAGSEETDIQELGGAPMVPPRDGESAPPPPRTVIWNRTRTAPLVTPDELARPR